MKKLLIILFALVVITYGVLLYFAADNYKQSKKLNHQIDSLKQITNEKTNLRRKD